MVEVRFLGCNNLKHDCVKTLKMQLHAVRKELDRSYQQASDLQTENKLLRAFENVADIYCNQGHSMKTQNVSEALV